jgi:uncharacterized protein YkwD
MKYVVLLLCLYPSIVVKAQSSATKLLQTSPLAVYDEVWNEPQYLTCNTANQISYLSGTEKQVIYILNLIRSNPKLFLNTVAKNYVQQSPFVNPTKNKIYIESLMETLNKLNPLPLLTPNEKCFLSARCLAQIAGQAGYMGHDRKTKACKNQSYFEAECIAYGNSDPLDIVMSLLIDAGIPSLSHRKICLDNYTSVGIDLYTHKTWRYIAVIDFAH